MDERYNRLQVVIDDLIAERDRALDDLVRVDALRERAEQEARRWRNAFVAEIGEEPQSRPLPWEVDAGARN